MYYNKEEKQNFINSYIRSRVIAETSLTGLFNKTYLFEKELSKDCSLFNKNEIINMYTKFNAKSINVLLNYNVILKSYVIFQIYNSKAIINQYQDIDKNDINNCIDINIIKNKYISRNEVDDIEDQLLNYTDKAIIECLWNGISGKNMEDLVSINKNMLDSSNGVLKLNSGVSIKMSERLNEYLNKAFDEVDYMCYGETMRIKRLNGYGCLYKERDNAHTIDSDDKFFRWVYRKIQNYRNYIDMPTLTMKNIQASGLLYTLQQNMNRYNYSSIRDFLYTETGKEIAIQYGFNSNYYVDVITNKLQDIIQKSR